MLLPDTFRRFVTLWLVAPAVALSQDPELLFSGEVFSRQAQEVLAPPTLSWSTRISMMLPEGSVVKSGEVVAQFDGSEIASQLEQQLETMRTDQAKAERDIAKLEKELIAAQFKLEQARIELQLAKLKADLPDGLIGGLEYADIKLAKEKAERNVIDAAEQFNDKREGVQEREQQAELDALKAANERQRLSRMLAYLSVRAVQPGFVIYGYNPWQRAKFREGDTIRTSFLVMQIADTSDLAIKVWVNGIDRPRIEAGMPVGIVLDALPEIGLDGHFESISASGSKRPQWGRALYYEGVVAIESGKNARLLPGMSALVELRP